MQNPTWIRARDLDNWARDPAARGLLPELIERLVKATVPSERREICDFASEAENHRQGFDGRTVVTPGSEFVPAGICLWEMGCDENPRAKAERDYTTRVTEHKERVASGETEDFTAASFTFVTPRDWHAKKGSKGKGTRPEAMADWANAKSGEKVFKQVCSLDSNRLEQWIREAPAVGLWLAKAMGKPVDGLDDVKSRWEDIQASLQRRLPHDVFLVSRGAVTEAFKIWLNGNPDLLAVRAPSAWEVVAVFAAWIESLPDAERNSHTARSIIVENKDSWRELAESTHPLILLSIPK